MRDVILQFFREYYDAGHIVALNVDVMAHKLADRLEQKSNLTNEQLNDAISIAHMMSLKTARENEGYAEIIKHLCYLLSEQKRRAT